MSCTWCCSGMAETFEPWQLMKSPQIYQIHSQNRSEPAPHPISRMGDFWVFMTCWLLNLHQTLSRVRIIWFCDRNETTRHCRCEGRATEEPVSHLTGTFLTFMRTCEQPGAEESLFRKTLPPLGSCPNWLTLYVDKHKHCAVSLNGERVHLYLCAFAVNGGPLLMLWSKCRQPVIPGWSYGVCQMYTDIRPASHWMKGEFKIRGFMRACLLSTYLHKSLWNEAFCIKTQWL